MARQEVKVTLMVMTNGRKDYIQATIESAKLCLPWYFYHEMIIDDSADKSYSDWLASMYSGFTIHPTKVRLGFCGTIQRGWDLLPEGTQYIFHLEDDFEFNEVIDIQAMIDILHLNQKLAQVSLLRQAWSGIEKEAGGIIQLHPQDFVENRRNGRTWLEHRRYFTTNPSLYPIAIARHRYPQCQSCEAVFSEYLRHECGYNFGILGRKSQKPKVIHIGQARGASAEFY